MLENIINPTNLLYLGVGLAYFILSFVILRSVKRVKKVITPQHIYTYGEDAEYVYEIMSNPCPICYRIDIIHFTERHMHSFTDNSIGVGEYQVVHDNHDHTITHYFNKLGNWLGDHIPPHQLIDELEKRELMQ